MIQRVFNVSPGYDCRVECQHEHKGQHGIHCDEWVYTVVDRDAHAALELEVYTPFYPATVDKRAILEVRKPFCGGILLLHYGYATSREAVLEADAERNCAYIGTCYPATFGLAAGVLVNKYFDNNLEDGWPNGPGNQLEEQPNLWAALEARLAELVEYGERQRREDGDLKWRVCECCKGAGTLEVAT